MYIDFEYVSRDLNRASHLLTKFYFDREGDFVCMDNFLSWLFMKVFVV